MLKLARIFLEFCLAELKFSLNLIASKTIIEKLPISSTSEYPILSVPYDEHLRNS